MRAAAVVGHGDIDQLKMVDWPEPQPAEGQVVVGVRACGLNYLDIFVRRGMPGLPVELPRITGGDIAGVVVSVGPNASKRWIGMRVLVDPKLRGGGVFGEHANGGLCERIAVDEGNLIPLPDEVTFEQAAALPIAYGTARRMLIERGKIQSGELVLILGASGGVGTACVQIANGLGAQVIACASSADKLERLRDLGATHLVNYATEDFSTRAWQISGKRGVDAAVNFTGGATWNATIRCLAVGGRVLTCGATAGFDVREDLRYVWRREADIRGSNAWRRSDLDALLADVATGRLSPVIDRVFPLSEAADAMRRIEDRVVFGKVIVIP